jgi:cysteine-rich repeat protein
VLPGCGNGVLEEGELCDEGAANSDTAPDACRSTCLPAGCGDAVIDAGEACDDGSAWGGDGCTPACTTEDGQLEDEPNDTWDDPEAWLGGVVNGALPRGDADCFVLSVRECSGMAARLLAPCPAPAVISLHDADGVLVAVGAPGDDGCAVLDPAEATGARFLEAGIHAVCVEGLVGEGVPWYALEIAPVDPEDAAWPIEDTDDPDGDGRPDRCDDDRDGDGVDDEVDNCPDVPNGPAMPALTPSDDGFLRAWLAAGPYTGTESTEPPCLPSDDALVAADEASVEPRLGDPAGSATWTVLWSLVDRIEFLTDYGAVDAPREVYTAIYVRSDAERTLTLALGPDDGARVWFDGVVVEDIAGCQGTVVDLFTVDVTLASGWNRLLVKVRDQGGGWGNYVRFLDGGVPVTDLELSLSPDGAWRPDQEDSDGDGHGDVCDDTPLGG